MFAFAGSPYYKTRNVTVQVESIDGERVAERTIELPAYDPVVRFYPEHPIWGTDLSEAIVADKPLLLNVPEMVVRSVPFFVSDSDSFAQVEYQWQMNGRPMATYGDRDILNLRAPESGEGTSRINLKVTHNGKLLQIAQSVFTVIFGEDAVREAQEVAGGDSTNYFGTF